MGFMTMKKLLQHQELKGPSEGHKGPFKLPIWQQFLLVMIMFADIDCKANHEVKWELLSLRSKPCRGFLPMLSKIHTHEQ